MTPPDEYRPFPIYGYRNWTQEHVEVPLLVRSLRIPQGLKILEIGCGPGIALSVLARLCKPEQLVGLDIDQDILAIATERLRSRRVDVELIHADAREIPLDDESFDMVIDFGTCYHIGRPGAALAEVARVLKPEGFFVCDTPANQLISHPIRSIGTRLPWSDAPELKPYRKAILWSSWIKR